MPDDIVDKLVEHDEDRGQIDDLEPEFREKLQELLDELRRRGWAARVATGPRTVDEQMELFQKRRTTLLRGSHLCRRAADLSLYPVGIPPTDHRFWDVKDEIAVGLGLDVVDYDPNAQKFVDRPHVQSTRCDTADWDRLKLSPVGTFEGSLDGDDLVVRFQRNGGSLQLSATLDGEPVPVSDFTRRRGEGAHKVRRDEIEFQLGGRQASGEFSTLKNESGLTRPDYRALHLTMDGSRVELERTD